MADVTARLIWYRLKENYENLAQTYEQFSWRRVDILDMLLLGWVLFAFVIVGLINLYLRFFGLPKSLQRRRDIDGGERGIDGSSSLANCADGYQDGETVQWINSGIAWFCENYSRTPGFIEGLLRTLNEEARQYTEKDLQIRFDGIQSGDIPPHFTNVSTDTREKDYLTVQGNIHCKNVTLLVSVITKMPTHMQTTGCQVHVVNLQGPLKLQSKLPDGQIQISFQSAPVIVVKVSPNSYGVNIDQSMIETVIEKTISRAFLFLTLPGFSSSHPITSSSFQASSSTTLTPSTVGQYNGHAGDDDSMTRCQIVPDRAIQKNTENEAAHENKSVSLTVTAENNREKCAFNNSLDTDCMKREVEMLTERVLAQKILKPKIDRISGGRETEGCRLLVKLIKANGLMDKDFTSCDPYCIVISDDPPQQHSTSVVKNTINPFFDEHFLFNINSTTRLIKFELYDRSKEKNDDFLGQASVVMDDLRRLPSSRQIIPLIGRPKATTSTSGSVTAEFLFMEGGNDNASNKTLTPLLDRSPPRRRVETSRSRTPGGVTVTTKTTTTTTEQSRDQKDDPFKYYESPTRVEKAETISSYASDSSPLPSGTSSRAGFILGSAISSSQVLTNGLDPNVAETALRQLSKQPHPPSRSASIVITGVQKMTKSPNAKQNKETISRDEAEPQDVAAKDDGDLSSETKKKSFASALKKAFTRNKKRSQSADRAQTFLLRPPEHGDGQSTTKTSDQSEYSVGGSLRKSRSHSFSSSFRNLFRRKKKNLSRESSLSRMSARGGGGGADTSREGSIVAQPSPQLVQPKGSVVARHNTPVPEFSPATGHPYSTSVPVRAAPLYDR